MTEKKKDYLFIWNDEDPSEMLKTLQRDFKIDLTSTEIKRSKQIMVETQTEKIELNHDKKNREVIAKSDTLGEKRYAAIEEKKKIKIYDYLIFEYQKDKEAYMRALETCIDFYKSHSWNTILSLMAISISMMALIRSNTTLLGTDSTINIIVLFLSLIVGLVGLIVFSWAIISLSKSQIPIPKHQELTSSLCLARIDPNHWRLLVAFSLCGGLGSIKNVRLERDDGSEEK